MKFTKNTRQQLISATLAAATMVLTACGGQTDSTSELAADTPDLELIRQPDREARVVGGSEVTDNRYPWMVAMMERGTDPSNGQFCGGTLIDSTWILTAAHCFENDQGRLDLNANKVSALLGQQNLAKDGGTTLNASRIIVHPEYRSNGYPDLALVELTQASSARPISLPSRNNPAPSVGETATVTGWGQISENGPATNQLKQVSMPVVGHNRCNNAYNGEIVEDAMVCAGTANGSSDSCYGDSGGPLFVKRGQSYVQAGVVSFGEECGLPNVPGVYARVSSYFDWIAGYANVSPFTTEDVSEPVNETPDIEVASSNVIQATCVELVCTMSANNIAATDHFWDFGDGYIDEGQTVQYEYDSAGQYTVTLGSITTQGDYVEQSTELTVEGAAGVDSKNSYQHSGRLGRRDQIDLPLDLSTLKFEAGTLNATLEVQDNRRVVLFVDQYDPQTDEWYEVARVRTRSGIALLELPIESGEYGFTLVSRGRGSDYDLSVSID